MPTFDVVSEVNMQEVRNAVDQAQKEIDQRYDFRGSKSSIALDEKVPSITIIGDDKMKLESLQEIIKQRMAKRGIGMKSLEFKDPEDASGNSLRQVILIKQGLSPEDLKKINKLLKDTKLKINSQIQGNQLRVSGKKRDDLQDAIQFLRGNVKDVELQYINFRD